MKNILFFEERDLTCCVTPWIFYHYKLKYKNKQDLYKQIRILAPSLQVVTHGSQLWSAPLHGESHTKVTSGYYD